MRVQTGVSSKDLAVIKEISELQRLEVKKNGSEEKNHERTTEKNIQKQPALSSSEEKEAEARASCPTNSETRKLLAKGLQWEECCLNWKNCCLRPSNCFVVKAIRSIKSEKDE